MTDLKILHCADLHLGANFPSLGEKGVRRKADFLATFERIVTLAIKNEVQLLLFAGDLFDSPVVDKEILARVQEACQRLSQRGIKPVLLPGNHDHLIDPESIYLKADFPGALVLTEPRVESPLELEVAGQQVFIYGFAWRDSLSDDALAGMKRRQRDGIHIGLLHGSRQGSPQWDYRPKDLPFTLAQVMEWNLDYLALGHYHEFELLERQSRILACYPGSSEGKRFGENGPRYCALVHIGDSGVRVEKLAVQGRRLEERTLDVAGCDDEDSVVQAICEQRDGDLILRLTLLGIVEAPLRLELIQQRCEEHFFHIELKDRTDLIDSEFVRRILDEPTIRGLFVRRAKALLARTEAERKPIVEQALREVLVRFQAFSKEDMP